MDVAVPLVRTILDTTYNELPQPVVDATKQHILHTIATIIGGSNASGCKMVVDLVKEWGGSQESTVLVYGTKIPSLHAALANGTMAHALDYCMNDDRTHYKTSVVVIPAALAMAEKKGGTNGRDFITAVCMGVELGIRIALAAEPKPFHALSPVLGCFASAASAGKILGLDEEQMLDCLGIAYCHATDKGLSIVSPSLTKRLGPGLAARAGVFSAQLAQKGFKAGRNCFQGPTGYFCSFNGQEGDLDDMTSDLGRRFEIVNVGPKGYPCCRVLHAPIDATLSLVREYHIKPEDVMEAIVYQSDQNFPVETDPETLKRKRHPRGEVDAQFSVTWGVAWALVKGEVFIDAFTEEGIKDPGVNALAEKVLEKADPGFSRMTTMLTPVIVEIRTKQGKTFSKRIDYPKGNPNNPVTMEETKESFRRCADFAARPLDPRRVEEAIEFICSLEDVDEVSKVAKLLSGN